MALLETAGLVLVLLVVLYWYLTRNHNYWAKKGIAFEKPVIIFGNVLDNFIGKRNPGQVHRDVYKKYKGERVVGMFNLMQPVLLIRDPSLVHQILTTDFAHFSSNDIDVDEKNDPVMASNIFCQNGEKWKRNRQALSPAFTASRIKSTYEKILTVNEKFVKYLETHPETELKAACSLYTSEVVASWGIGIDGQSFTSDDPILPRLGKLMFQPSMWGLFKFLAIVYTPSLASIFSIKFVPDEVPDFFNGVVKDLIDSRGSDSGVQHRDFLQYFIDLRNKRAISKNDDQNDIDDRNIMNAIVSFFLEGYETSSLILSHLLYELTINPLIQQQLRANIDELFAAKATPTFEEVNDLPLLARIYSETVRHYGGFSLLKRCTKEYKMDVGNGRTITVEKGTPAIIPLLGLHKDPAYWGENCDEFDPSRWTDDFTPVKGSYLPFGDGPRVCIGMRIASTVIKTAVVHIVRNFDLLRTKQTAAKFVQDPTHFMSMLKGGIHIRMSKRNF